MALDAPPPYSAHSAIALPPILSSNHLLITPTLLTSHLSLLGAFHVLRHSIQHSDLTGPWESLDPIVRWSVFLNQAVWRFEQWIDKVVNIVGASEKIESPPLDVSLVWHAYLLNPRWYQDDGERRLGGLKEFTKMRLEEIAGKIDEETRVFTPTEVQVSQWENLVSTPFDPLESFRHSQGREVVWHFTGEVSFVPWINDSGTGYAQVGFKYRTSTGRTLTHEVLGIAKLVSDIVGCQKGTTFLAGTSFVANEKNSPAVAIARREKVNKFLLHGKLLKSKDAVLLGDLMGWSMAGANRTLRQVFPGGGGLALTGILRCYMRGEPFSIDLVPAVLRQETFLQRMVDLGWTHSSRFPPSDTSLVRCATRYYAFLDLIKGNPSLFCVPTLDIDLAWHTHQLDSNNYRKDMMKLLGRFVDHDDRVEEGVLSTSYDDTARAWQTRFGVPYSTCGCPLPASRSTLYRIFNYSPSTPRTTTSQLQSLLTGPSLEGTHPSSHNSILLITDRSAQKNRKKRKKENQKRKAAPGYTGDHEIAFLCPIPTYPIYGPMGYPAAMGGCAVVCGDVMSGDAGTTCPAGTGNPGYNGPGSCATSSISSCAAVASQGTSSSSGVLACAASSNTGGGGWFSSCGASSSAAACGSSAGASACGSSGGGGGGCGGGGGGGGGGGCGGGGN